MVKSDNEVSNGNRLYLCTFFQMLFLIILVGKAYCLTTLPPEFIPTMGTFDNTGLLKIRTPQLQPCQITNTEHFSQSSDVYSEGQLNIHSSRILGEIIKHLLFLTDLEKHIYFSESQNQYITFVNFFTSLRLHSNARSC